MKILITPLDWGLGHATRCIPIIREFLSRGCSVFVGGNGDSLTLLKNEFPELVFFTLPGYQPVYPSSGSMVTKMISQIPKFLRAIYKEHRLVESIIQSNRIDLIISDNRYGCWSAQVPSIFMTHQLNIMMPAGLMWLASAINYLNQRLIKKFSRCWIPDYPNHEASLSGRLSEIDGMLVDRIAHIGPLSRFTWSTEGSHTYDVACILSGPEPQRTIFEKKVVNQLKRSTLRYIVARGILGEPHSAECDGAAFMNSQALQDVISRSSLVIARSGYSTIMDLVALRKKGVVVPTPGQTEQEYLADRWSKKGVLYTMSQESFSLDIAWRESSRYTGFKDIGLYPTKLLKDEIDLLMTS